jgi:hypothetical protein
VLIDTSPKGVILVATSGGKRAPRGVDRLIHRSAWKGNSPKFGCNIMDKSLREAPKHPVGPILEIEVDTTCCGAG